MKELNYPNFTGRNVPIAEIAAAMRKNQQFVRLGLQNGYLKFGIAVKTGTGKGKEYTYYCPDRKVYEEIGYFRDAGATSDEVSNG